MDVRKITLLCGEKNAYKSTVLLQSMYQELESKTSVLSKPESPIYGLLITQKNEIWQSNWFFGKYNIVDIDIIKSIKIKYIEDSFSLIEFLKDIHLLKSPPAIIGIDNIDHYISPTIMAKSLEQREMRFFLTLSLLQNNLYVSGMENTQILATMKPANVGEIKNMNNYIQLNNKLHRFARLIFIERAATHKKNQEKGINEKIVGKEVEQSDLGAYSLINTNIKILNESFNSLNNYLAHS